MNSVPKFGFWKSTVLLAAVLHAPAVRADAPAGEISYNRDIRPLLSDNCFHCHGPDASHRKGKLRLDVREAALEKEAFVPGKADESELLIRIHSKDEEELMPPPDSAKTLTEAQKELFRRWIAEGAKYEKHWAYIAPQKTEAPEATAVDFLVQKRLKSVGLEPSPEADKRTLIRRLYLDLVGLPPKPEEVEDFEKDEAPDAYKKLVDKLLAAPQYGERMALGWLDVVRFADTIGYHSDNPRNIWPYRDYVIRAFNENKRFDQFTREQLAGDLLPGSTLEQKVGSAFNRLLLSTEEGGAQPKDYESRMLTDRVRAVGTVWLGQTIGCAQCHDHKFDPIKARDFYAMGAFFADIQEPIIGPREPGITVPSDDQTKELGRLDGEITRLEKEYAEPYPELADEFQKWISSEQEKLALDRRWKALVPDRVDSKGGATLAVLPDRSVLASGGKGLNEIYTFVVSDNPEEEIGGLRIEVLPDDSLPEKGPGRGKDGSFALTEVVAHLARADAQTETIRFDAAWASFEQTNDPGSNPYKYWNAASVIDHDVLGDSFGWAIMPQVGKAHSLVLEFAEALTIRPGDVLTLELKQNRNKDDLGRFRISAASMDVVRAPMYPPLPTDVVAALDLPEEKRGHAPYLRLFKHYKSVAPELAPLRASLAAARKAKSDYESGIPRCLVAEVAATPRTVRILPRGNFLVETGDIVEPALPIYLAGEKKDSRRLTRLDLANWLVSRENPLTSRVIMNRLWKQFFGMGLSKVLDDFGAQGEPPPNQELLDWLACEFMDSGWDTKHMVRVMVNSQTYKQIAISKTEVRAKDPFNRELASQSRWRLDAELVRDNALAISGLLFEKVGGPSARPFQPEGYWENLNFPTRTWEQSGGREQYRRGLYTWWQRSYLHPSLLAFDAPSREECVAERNRSNIPQQALVLLNDPVYVEASRVFAARILKEGGADTAARLNWAWRQALVRAPRADELEAIQALLVKHLANYKQDVPAADALLKIGQTPLPENMDHAELAAWTNIARVILNLHETITRS